jgi:large subunit ribosomal protein L30
MAKSLQITQVRSGVGRIKPQKATIRALGLRKLGQTVVQKDNACVRGMIAKVCHLVTVKEVDGEA